MRLASAHDALQETVARLQERIDQQQASRDDHGPLNDSSHPAGSASNPVQLGSSSPHPPAAGGGLTAGVGLAGGLGAGSATNGMAATSVSPVGHFPHPAFGWGTGGLHPWNGGVHAGGLPGGSAGAFGVNGMAWPGFGGGVVPPSTIPPYVGRVGFSGLPGSSYPSLGAAERGDSTFHATNISRRLSMTVRSPSGATM